MMNSDMDFEDDEIFDLEQAPLDNLDPLDVDWGGDGSDLTRPVRAHVLAALPPSSGPFAPPLDAVITLGEAESAELEQVRVEQGIGQEHLPELVRMLRDRTLNTIYGNTEAWAPYHALRLMAQLDLSAVVPDLMPMFDLDFDLVSDELLGMIAAVGAPAFEPLRAYLHDTSRWVWGRSRVADIVQLLAEQHPALRADVVAALTEVLAQAETEHEIVVAGVIGALVGLKAVEALPLIRRAYEAERVDETVNGPWGDVLAAIGVEPEADDPLIAESRRRFEERHNALFPIDMQQNLAALRSQVRAEDVHVEGQPANKRRKQEKARKEKNKRKASSASRKANRKKRK